MCVCYNLQNCTWGNRNSKQCSSSWSCSPKLDMHINHQKIFLRGFLLFCLPVGLFMVISKALFSIVSLNNFKQLFSDLAYFCHFQFSGIERSPCRFPVVWAWGYARLSYWWTCFAKNVKGKLHLHLNSHRKHKICCYWWYISLKMQTYSSLSNK